MRQSPALQSPLPDFNPPQGTRGQDIMIIWDFQASRGPAWALCHSLHCVCFTVLKMVHPSMIAECEDTNRAGAGGCDQVRLREEVQVMEVDRSMSKHGHPLQKRQY